MANPLMCLQGDVQAGPRRVTRQPIVFQRPKNQQQMQQQHQQVILSSKTKGALCFLCLFDGLRTPTIRRLSRKPRSICNKPLLTFDPSVFAPSSQNALQEIYMSSLKCSAEMVVDPPVKDVIDMIRRQTQTGTPDRLVLHYFGQGCMQPTADGSIFFFSDDRLRYKPVKIDVLRKNCPSPLCAIIDCPNAAVLAPFFSQPDSIGFFACSQNEQLPISTDAPWDLFSSCLLSPFETAVWWHSRRHSCVFDIQYNTYKDQNCFIKQFFYALLEAIAFDTQPQSVMETFSRDPAMMSLARGFVLSQRVMQSFNLHPVSQPQMKPTSSHDLWFFWDTAIDCSLAMPEDEAAKMIFKLFISSFNNFPNLGVLPIFSFFISRPEFRNETVTILINYLDQHSDVSDVIARSNVAKTIVEMSNPSEITVLLLVKMLALGCGTSPFQQQWPFWYKPESPVSEIKAGMLAICIAIQSNCVSSFTKISNICIQKATECSPYSAILLGQLLKSAQRLWNLPPFGSKFLPLLSSQNDEDKVAGAYIIGLIKEKNAIQQLINNMKDSSALVRAQSTIALGTIYASSQDGEAAEALRNAAAGNDKAVAEIAQLILDGKLEKAQKKSDVLTIILDHVKGNGFLEKYRKGLLKCE